MSRARVRDHRHPRLRPRPPLRAREVASRRGRLRRARRQVEAFSADNRYRRELKGTTLALIRHLEAHWRRPRWRDDYDSWWPFINRYAEALATDPFTGRGAYRRLQRLLGRNQECPKNL